MIAVVAFIVFVERSERRIPIQSARRIVGRRMMGGQSSHLPLKVNSGGVMPVIFASSILSAPLLLRPGGVGAEQPLLPAHHSGAAARAIPGTSCSYMLGIIFFAYFYVSIVMKPDDIADNFRKSGSFIPGIRPGKRTSDFINDILTRITLVGALYLIVISAGAYVPHLGHSVRQDLADWSGSSKTCRTGRPTVWASTSTLAALRC